ncbi:MAG: hypothetical protein IPJ46_11320 [Anaerolineales bacterium]|nr:hypothetical protein [Anaerolineales bacterium]
MTSTNSNFKGIGFLLLAMLIGSLQAVAVIHANRVPKMQYYREYFQYPSLDMVPCMKVNGGDFILKGYSGGIIIQNTSPVEKIRIILS